MKGFKLIVWAACLAILLAACGGKVRNNMSSPGMDEDHVPVGKIERIVPNVAHV